MFETIRIPHFCRVLLVSCAPHLPTQPATRDGGARTQRQGDTVQPRLPARATIRNGTPAAPAQRLAARIRSEKQPRVRRDHGVAASGLSATFPGRGRRGVSDRTIAGLPHRFGRGSRYRTNMVSRKGRRNGPADGVRYARGLQPALLSGIRTRFARDLEAAPAASRSLGRFLCEAGYGPLRAQAREALGRRPQRVRSDDRLGSCPAIFRRQACGMVRLTQKGAADV